MEASTALPESKEKLLSHLDSLNYNERINYAARMGRDHKESPKLKELIGNLLDHPKPDAPQMEVEEEFVKILPPQKTNVSKYYNEDQVAMFAAVASKTQLALLQESLVSSPSIMFKKLVVKAVVRQEKDDNVVYEALVGAVPKLQKKLLHACIRYRRVPILEKAFPVLRKEHGVDHVADFLHGCSASFVEEQLKDEEVCDSKALNWRGLGRHHGKVLIEMLRKDLLAKSELEAEEYKLDEVWSLWQRRIGSAAKELLINTGLSGDLLKLAFDEVPILEYTGAGYKPRRKELKAEDSVAVFPDFISSHFSLFIAKHPEKMLDLCKKAVFVEKRSKVPRLRVYLPSAMWRGKLAWRKLRSNRFEWIYALINDILSKSTPVSMFSDFYCASSAFDHSSFASGGNWVSPDFWNSKYFSAAQILKLANTFLDYLLKVRPTPENYASWNLEQADYQDVVNAWRQFVKNLFSSIFTALGSEQIILDIREKILEGPAPASKAVAASFKPVSSRRSRGRNVAPPQPVEAKKKRVHKWTEEEKTEERKKIQRQKANISSILGSLLKREEEIVNPAIWHFKIEGESPEDTQARRSNDLLEFARNTRSATRPHSSYLLYYYDNIQPLLTAGLDVRDGGTKFGIINQTFLLLEDLDNIRKDPRRAQEVREEALQGRTRVWTDSFEMWKAEPVINVDELIRLMKYALPEQRFAIFELFDDSTLEHLGENSPEILESLFDSIMDVRGSDSKLDFGKVDNALSKLLEDGVMSNETRDQLLPFKNVEDHKVRKEMTKAADSNNTSERNFAFRTLIKATKISRSAVQMKRTLTFFRTKLKNESAENRGEGLGMILSDLTDNITHTADPANSAYTELLFSSDCLPVWDLMLKDTLEAPDLAENEDVLLSHFTRLSKAAISRSAGETATNPLFGFGVEIQWKISVFKLGMKKSCKNFRIHFSDSLKPSSYSKFFPKGSEEQFVDGIVKAYNSRVLEKNPKFWEEPTVLENLFAVLGKGWVNSPALLSNAQNIIAQLKKAPLDDDGLYILKHDNEGIQVFEKIFALHSAYKDRRGEEWYDIPVLVEYVETVLRSRQAPRVLFQWLLKNSQGKTRKERKQNRSKAVDTLLSITLSAIHLRFVWRHLLRYQQNRLDQFLNSQKTFRGVFYLSPKKRVALAKTAAGRKAAWAETFGEDVLEKIKKEKEKEEEIQKEREEFEEEEHEAGQEFDSDEFFILPATHGLHRLLPRQANTLAKQRMNQIMNDNLSLPDRTAATIRWTLVPTVTYADMVQFFGKYEKGTTALAVNILEAALRGVMYNDEPCAPLQYLLSPKFLGSDRARVAMYCVSKCVPYMPASQMTETLVMVLTGKRRNSLKVTAYKEIIRVLASRPTARHMEMILHEWKRPVLHRDVRIAIVQKAVSFLIKDIGEEIAWDILKSCLTTHSKNAELEMALLGITPAAGRRTERSYRYSSGLTNFQHLCMKPRLYEHYETLTKSQVPEKHCTTYFDEIIYPLATSALDDDVKHLAIAVAPYWREFTDKEKLAKLLFTEIVNMDPTVINNTKPDVQRVHNSRYEQYMTSLLDIAGISIGHYGTYDGDEVVNTIRKLVLQSFDIIADGIKKMPIKERETRANLCNRLKYAFNLLPSNGPGNNYAQEFEELLLAPFKGMGQLFAVDILSRRVYQNVCQSSWSDVAVPLLHDLFSYAVTYPSSAKEITDIAERHIGTCYSGYEPYRKYAHPALTALLDNNLCESDEDKDIRNNPKYKYLVHRTLFKSLHKFPEFFAAKPKAVINFLVQSFSYLESGSVDASAPTVAETFVSNMVDVVREFDSANSSSNSYGNRSIPNPCMIELLQNLLALTVDDNVSISKPAVQLFLRLAQENAQMLVEALPTYLCYILHMAALQHCELRTSDSKWKMEKVAFALIEALEKRMEFEVSDEPTDPKDPRLSAPSIGLVTALVSNALLSADPLPIPGAEDLADTKISAKISEKAKKAASRQPGPYANAIFEVALCVVAHSNTWASYLLSRPEMGRKLIHQAIVRMTGYADQTPTTDIKSKLDAFIQFAFDRSTTLSLFEGEDKDEEAKAANDESRAQVDEAVEQVVALINDILSMNLYDKSESEGALGFLLSAYRHMSAHVALDVLLHFGTKTVLEIPKKTDAEEVDAGEKEKKGEDEEDTKQTEGNAEEEDESGKKKAEKKKKKEKPSVERIWRPRLVELLDKLSEDEDATIELKASFTVTRTVCAGTISYAAKPFSSGDW